MSKKEFFVILAIGLFLPALFVIFILFWNFAGQGAVYSVKLNITRNAPISSLSEAALKNQTQQIFNIFEKDYNSYKNQKALVEIDNQLGDYRCFNFPDNNNKCEGDLYYSYLGEDISEDGNAQISVYFFPPGEKNTKKSQNEMKNIFQRFVDTHGKQFPLLKFEIKISEAHPGNI